MLKDISLKPNSGTMLTAAALSNGPPIEPLSRLFLYTDEQWEEFTDEWAHSCLKKKYGYTKVQRQSGSRDKGIDIAGYCDDKLLMGRWDNFQCKNYDHPLYPSDIWIEIGKMLWYSFSGVYKAPKNYYFVAPREVGTTLAQYLGNKAKLKEEFLKVWDEKCASEITETQTIPLTGDFAEYVNKFDFGIFKSVSIRDVLEHLKATPYYLKRFGGTLPDRPTPDAPPEEVAPHESVYVAELLKAYTEHSGETIAAVAGLSGKAKLNDHFKRQREAFYHAESLRVFVRDNVAQGTFESLQEEIYHGVVDTCDAVHADGYERVVAVTDAAHNLPIDSHPLVSSTFGRDKRGICHQLANEERLKWTK